MRPLVALVALVAGVAAVHRPRAPDTPTAVPNDNTVAGGRMVGDTLVLALDLRPARWFPEADGGASVEVAAFAEAGQPPRIPGPLVRVREGATIRVTVRNTLPDSAVTVFGLVTRPTATDSGLRLDPGATRTVRFAAGAPGTYFYSATVGRRNPNLEREQLAGGFVVDPADGSPPDRVFVINIWGEPVDSTGYRNALAINGKSWPHTERLAATVGDSIRWRVINASQRPHPMHLHGVYYQVGSRGTRLGDSTYAPSGRRLVVTESMAPGSTMSLAWRPDRPGNWLFHCHLMFHAVEFARLDLAEHDRHSSDVTKHMAGLVLGIAVAPRTAEPEEARRAARRLRLHALQGPARGRSERSRSFVLQRDGSPPAADSVENPGSLLVLTRGQATDIVVLNRMAEPTAVHWHGIELESWSDGVAGWSGIGDRRAPAIAPGDSFTARLTLPRAGTFIYHTHLNDIEQVTSGLYGPLIVLEPGQRYDPETDHVVLVSWSGTAEPPRFLTNGDSLPQTMVLKAGVSHRFRFINIAPAGMPRFSLVQDAVVQSWRPIAKDGADLPDTRRIMEPATVLFAVGETYDMEWRPPVPGEYALVAPPGRPIRRIIVR